MSDLLASSGDALGRVPSGYGERHVRTVWFGTGEARLRSLVSKDRSYKPVVKSSGAQRESDGVVVPLIAVSNPAGGKGPDFGHAGEEVSVRAWRGPPRPTTPRAAMWPPVKVRRLQNRLWAAAKQSQGRRFHALYDRIYRSDVLWEAWERVRANRGAAGVDGLTLAAVEDYGVQRMLDELQGRLRAGIYRPAPVRRVEIPKPDGSKRPLGIPTVTDRVSQQAAKIVLEPLFEADFLPASSGSARSGRPPTPWSGCRVGFIEGSQFVFEADIEDFFGQMDQEQVAVAGRGPGVGPAGAQTVAAVAAGRGGGRRGGLRDGHGHTSGRGHLPAVGQHLPARVRPGLGERGAGEVVRYADDFVVLCSTRAEAEQAQERATAILGELGLRLHPDKTRVVDLREGKAGLRLPRMPSSCPHVGSAVGAAAHHPLLPASLAVAAVDEAGPGSGQGSHRSKPGGDGVGGRHRTAKPVPSGMGQLLPHRERRREVRQLDRHVAWRLRRLLIKKRGRNLRAGPDETMDGDLVPRPGPAQAHGHYPLPEGSVTMSRRPSVSRMRENRTYGLKGGWGTGSARGHRAPDYQ